MGFLIQVEKVRNLASHNLLCIDNLAYSIASLVHSLLFHNQNEFVLHRLPFENNNKLELGPRTVLDSV